MISTDRTGSDYCDCRSCDGSDAYRRISLDDASRGKADGEEVRIGMVVISGSAIIMLETLDRVNQDIPRSGR